MSEAYDLTYVEAVMARLNVGLQEFVAAWAEPLRKAVHDVAPPLANLALWVWYAEAGMPCGKGEEGRQRWARTTRFRRSSKLRAAWRLARQMQRLPAPAHAEASGG